MSGTPKLNILVVDDEEIVRETIMEFIDFLGHTAEEAIDGLAGLKALETRRYDATFADIRMPGLNGMGFLARARQVQQGIPIVMISGHGCDETRKEAMDAGAFAFLNKPFKFTEFEDLIAKIAARAH